MSVVFADTSYFVALLNPADADHRRALDYTRGSSRRMITTVWVLTELANFLRFDAGRDKFLQAFAHLESEPETVIVPADQQMWLRGLKLFQERPDKQWSLTDCISFVVMKEMGVTEALSTDQHFAQAGFSALLIG